MLGNGANSHKIIKVPLEELGVWDATHDAVGRPLGYAQSNSHESTKEEVAQQKV